MKQYLKIIASTFIGAFSTALLISSGFLFTGNINGFLPFLFLATIVGFVGYGIAGSFLWWCWHRYYFSHKAGFGAHKWSAFMGAGILSVLFVISASLGFSRHAEAGFGIIFTLIGATSSVISYYFVFHRCKTNA